MKLAIFYPRNTYAGWYSLGGYGQTLARMGHHVIDCWLPGNQPHDLESQRLRLPALQTLDGCDAVLSLYHEYTQPWLKAVYGEDWLKLAAPVIARYDESMDRADLGLMGRMPELLAWAKHHSFPAAQDAKRWEGQWLPYGADTTMFDAFSEDGGTVGEKRYDVAFIGSLYPVRMTYLQKLAEQLPNTFRFNCGPVGVQDLTGMREPESTQMLAEEYRKIKVFFCLPPMSRLIVAKVFDVMACGTFVMYPRLPGDARENLSLFEDGRHIVYYEPGYLRENGKQIKRWIHDDAEREKIARAGCVKVREQYTLEKMLDAMLAPVREEVPA